MRLDLNSNRRRDFKRHNTCREYEIITEELLSVLIFAVIVMGNSQFGKVRLVTSC